MEKAAVVFVAEQHGTELFHFGPMITPLAEQQGRELVGEGDFDFAEVTGSLGHLAGAPKQPVHEAQSQARRNDQQPDAFERVGAEQGDMGLVGEALGKFLIPDDLELGELNGEFEPEKNG